MSSGRKRQVELLDAGGEGKAGLAEPALRVRLGSADCLFFEESLQHLGKAEVLCGRAVQPAIDAGSEMGKLELGRERLHTHPCTATGCSVVASTWTHAS